MRVKGGFARRRKHNKVLARTKGFRMTKNRLYKVAREADIHAGQYAFHGRKRRKRDLRSLWITRINSLLKEPGLNYSKFINGLKKAKINLDRKILAELALNNPEVFREILQKIKSLDNKK